MVTLTALIVIPHELAAVLNHLHEGDIVCLIHVDSKIDAWVGDEKVGPFAHATFATAETRRATLWLHRRSNFSRGVVTRSDGLPGSVRWRLSPSCGDPSERGDNLRPIGYAKFVATGAGGGAD
jgi:hypothetical protein